MPGRDVNLVSAGVDEAYGAILQGMVDRERGGRPVDTFRPAVRICTAAVEGMRWPLAVLSKIFAMTDPVQDRQAALLAALAPFLERLYYIVAGGGLDGTELSVGIEEAGCNLARDQDFDRSKVVVMKHPIRAAYPPLRKFRCAVGGTRQFFQVAPAICRDANNQDMDTARAIRANPEGHARAAF